MIRNIKRLAVAAAALSLALSSTAFANVIYAPGVSAGASAGQASGDTQVGTAPSGSSAAQTAQPAAETAQSGTQYLQVGANGPTGGSGSVISNNQAGAATVPGSTTAVPGGTSAPGSAAGIPAAAQNASGGGSQGEGVTVDPITGQAPLINAVMIDTNGNAEAPFSTNTGACTSTTDGFSGLWICYDRAIGDVYYRVYTNEYGWSKWAMNEMITPNAKDTKVTAVEIRTTGYTHNNYSIYYQATLNDGTTLGWARDGQAAGAFGNGKYIQSLEIKLFKRGTGSTGNYQQGAAYEGVITGSDGHAYYSTFDGRAYTGWAYDVNNNKYYFSNNNIVTGWQYIDGYKYYFDGNGVVVTDLEPIIGLTGDYQIKINKAMKTMTIYGKDGENGYIMPVKVILNTIGPDTPIGTFKTYEAFRWKYMHDTDEYGPLYCQFLLRFKNGFLLHSIIYANVADSYHLLADTYNQLGKNQSDGCVRMLS
ncbi:MAG: L,D-transpeptidase family protein, partial [Eubacteriales bacterium]|nr:L,D-transpeptidase family protein [Eubacteriales bacterium]